MNINNTLLVIYKAIIKLVFISDTVTVAPPYLQSLSHLLTYSHYHTSLPTVTVAPPYLVTVRPHLQSLSHLLTYSHCHTSSPTVRQSPCITHISSSLPIKRTTELENDCYTSIVYRKSSRLRSCVDTSARLHDAYRLHGWQERCIHCTVHGSVMMH